MSGALLQPESLLPKPRPITLDFANTNGQALEETQIYFRRCGITLPETGSDLCFSIRSGLLAFDAFSKDKGEQESEANEINTEAGSW